MKTPIAVLCPEPVDQIFDADVIEFDLLVEGVDFAADFGTGILPLTVSFLRLRLKREIRRIKAALEPPLFIPSSSLASSMYH